MKRRPFRLTASQTGTPGAVEARRLDETSQFAPAISLCDLAISRASAAVIR